MIANLIAYFHWSGLLSVALWLLALLLLACFSCSRRRTVMFGAAFLLSLLAVYSARINSATVSAIRPDRTAEVEAERLRQQQLIEAARQREGVSRVRFAEDRGLDRLDLAGVETKKANNIYEAAAMGMDVEQFSYRERGRQERAAGRQRDDVRELIDGVKKSDELTTQQQARVLPAAELAVANRLDRTNLLLVRIVLLLTVLALLLDYLLRFNSTLRPLYPLPLAGRILDWLVPKTYSALVPTKLPALIQNYMRNVVRRGEVFIYLGDDDPWHWPQVVRFNCSWHGLAQVLRDNPLGEPVARVGARIVASVGQQTQKLRRPLARIKSWCRPLLMILRLILKFLFWPLLKLLQLFCRHYPEIANLIIAVVAATWHALLWVWQRFRHGFVAWITRIHYDAGNPVLSSQFVFESAWFGRYCFCIADPDQHQVVMVQLIADLEARRRCGARARRTVHLLYNPATASFTAAQLQQLLQLCPLTNFKLVVFNRDAVPAPVEFEEVYALSR